MALAGTSAVILLGYSTPTAGNPIAAIGHDSQPPQCEIRATVRIRERPKVEADLAKLADEWEQATALLSSIGEMASHPAYQRIIGKGPRAVPFLLSRLQEDAPSYWFWALKSITGADPVAAADRGDIGKMASAWLAWGKAHGYC